MCNNYMNILVLVTMQKVLLREEPWKWLVTSEDIMFITIWCAIIREELAYRRKPDNSSDRYAF